MKCDWFPAQGMMKMYDQKTGNLLLVYDAKTDTFTMAEGVTFDQILRILYAEHLPKLKGAQ